MIWLIWHNILWYFLFFFIRDIRSTRQFPGTEFLSDFPLYYVKSVEINIHSCTKCINKEDYVGKLCDAK